MVYTLVAADAVVSLPQTGNRTVVANKECPTGLTVIFSLLIFRYISLVDTFVIMQQHTRNIQPIRAGHTVFTVITGDGGILHHQVGCIVEELNFLLLERLQRTKRVQIVLQVFHIGHAAQDGQHSGMRSCETESPGCDAAVRLPLFETGNDMVVHFGKTSAQ